jgi:hypothetical protein
MLANKSPDERLMPGSKSVTKSGPSFIQHQWQSRRARAGLISIISRSLGALAVALGILLSSLDFANAATSVDFYVYEGSQSGPGFTSGSTVTVSTGLNELALCINTQSGTAPNVTYTPLCNTAAAPGSGLSDGNMYTAVAFIGTYTDSNNNPINLFAVGDLNGNVYLMYPTVNSQGVPQTMVEYGQYAYTNMCGSSSLCGRITALAKDPHSNTLYISFAQINESCTDSWTTVKFVDYKGRVSQAALLVITINSTDGSLAATPSNTYVNYAWQDYGEYYGICGNGTFDYVSPKLRVYPPDYPAFAATNYSSTGVVFYSGIIGTGASSSSTPVNKGYLCSGTQCQVSYNITLSTNTFSIMTSAEYGVDNRDGVPVPVLYWNQVEGQWVDYKSGKNPGFWSAIAKDTGNIVQSCQLTSLISAAITNSACQSYVPLTWPPAAAPSAGPFVNEMVYLQTPINATASPPAPYGSPSSIGVLMMSVWSPGYLAFHALDGNEGTSLLFTGNGSNGEIGSNPVSLIPDLNGAVFMQAGAEGLVGFNIFAEDDNLGTTLDDFTYIDITSSSSGGGSAINTGSAVLNGIDVIGSVASTVGLIIALAPEPAISQPKRSGPTAGVQSFTLEGALGSQPHRGQYTYDEATMKKSGIRRGQWITGLRFAVAEGISSRPKQNIRIEEFQLQLESGGKVGSRPSSSYPKTVIERSLCIASESYDRTKGPGARRAKRYGFGPVIWFDRPYRYLGGDMTMSIFGSGYSYGEFSFYIEAATGSGVSGAYVTGPQALDILPSDFPEVHAAPNVIFEKGRHSYGRRSLQCN